MQSRIRWLARPWSAEGAVKPRELQQLRERYARLTDVDLVRMHGQGPDAFASAEVWGLLDQEWHRRRTEIERTDQEEEQRSRAQLPIALSNAVADARRWARLTNTLLKTEMAICGGVMVTILGGATGWGAWQPVVIWGVFTLNSLVLVIFVNLRCSCGVNATVEWTRGRPTTDTGSSMTARSQLRSSRSRDCSAPGNPITL